MYVNPVEPPPNVKAGVHVWAAKYELKALPEPNVIDVTVGVSVIEGTPELSVAKTAEFAVANPVIVLAAEE